MSDKSIDALRRKLLSAAWILPAWCAAAPFLVHAEGTAALTPAGRFSGIRRDGMWCFYGIRYGIDTALTRFQAPRPAAAVAGTVKAWEFGSISPQSARTIEKQSEDCLFLNICSPSIDARAKRCVMVYIHGGAYSHGSGNDPLTDGVALAARGDVVVVTLTHRLNAFGYLSLARVDPRFPESGNAGQLDLILALQWVRDNIAAFGGDPDNVMLFGQSGGGAKIATLMATSAAKGLFHKVATMSGQQVTVSGPMNATRRAESYLAKLGVDPVGASVQKMVDALSAIDPVLGGGVYFGPVLDGRHLLRHPFYPDAHPQSLALPMLLGNTIAETRAFFPPHHPKLQGLSWRNLTERIGSELRVDISPEHVIDAYRQWFPEKSPVDIFIAATTASRSWRGQVIEAEERARAGAPAFVYQLDFQWATHTDDLGLVFGTKLRMTPAERAMGNRMMDAFVAFAKTGNPGWPHYDLVMRNTMVFDVGSRVEVDPRRRERELFAVVPYVQSGT